MARALRPAVLLILLASLLFLLDGYVDGVYPGGSHGSLTAYSGLGWTSYLFAFVNAIVAILIARGSERMLALRIGLAAFFIFERSVSAVALGVKPVESLVVHGVTALIEAVILASTMRVWRLGHSVVEADMSLLTLPGVPMPAAAAAGAGSGPSLAVAMDAAPARRGFRLPSFKRGGRKADTEPLVPPAAPEAAPKEREPMAVKVRTLTRRMTWTLALLSLGLAAALVADAAVAGIVPGVTVDLASPEWLVYVFALVLLVVASRAVHGGRFAMRLLLIVALIYFVERAFTPFALRLSDPVSLALHFLAALVSLALALATASAIRGTRLPRPAPAS